MEAMNLNNFLHYQFVQNELNRLSMSSEQTANQEQEIDSTFDAEYNAIKSEHDRIAREIAQAREELEKNRKFF